MWWMSSKSTTTGSLISTLSMSVLSFRWRKGLLVRRKKMCWGVLDWTVSVPTLLRTTKKTHSLRATLGWSTTTKPTTLLCPRYQTNRSVGIGSLTSRFSWTNNTIENIMFVKSSISLLCTWKMLSRSIVWEWGLWLNRWNDILFD